MAKGNPDPSPSTRFGAENGNTPGRKHTKDKLSQAFLADLQEVWKLKGRAVLDELADGDTKAKSALAKIVAGMEPKTVEHSRPTDGLDDEKLDRVIALLQADDDAKATVQ